MRTRSRISVASNGFATKSDAPAIEGRAIDWHLDAHDAADRRAAERLARMLLAPDSRGNPQALARRMGGQLRVSGALGGGALAELRLPLAIDEGKVRARS